METIKKNIANLIKVKTIVTMVVIAVFAILAVRGDITADNVNGNRILFWHAGREKDLIC